MKTQTVAELVGSLGACPEAVEWVTPYGKDARKAWRECHRGDWLLWFAARINVHRPLVVIAACSCVRLALTWHWGRWCSTTNDGRPRRAVESAERWARGGTKPPAVRHAAAAKAIASTRDGDGLYRHACSAAANAADAAGYAACASNTDASYAYALSVMSAAKAAASAHLDAAKAHVRCARRVRRLIPWSLVSERLKAER
jgi:hypothetical protein